MNKQRKVYVIFDKDENFVGHIKPSELNKATLYVLKSDKKVTIEEAHISDNQFKLLFS